LKDNSKIKVEDFTEDLNDVVSKNEDLIKGYILNNFFVIKTINFPKIKNK
jgi:hypothetical protein